MLNCCVAQPLNGCDSVRFHQFTQARALRLLDFHGSLTINNTCNSAVF